MNYKNVGLLLLISSAVLNAEVGRVHRGKMYDIENEDRIVDEKQLSFLRLTLWKSTLQDAQKIVGKGPIHQRRYASGEYDSQICYSNPGIVLLLNSQRDPQHPQEIDQIIVSNEKSIPENFNSCVPSSKIDSTLTFMGGMKLGMSSNKVQQLWGKAGKITHDKLIYEIRRTQNEYFTDDISIYLEFVNDKLVFAKISRFASH